MGLFRSRPRTVAEVVLHSPSRVSARIDPGPGHAPSLLTDAERIHMAVGAVTLAYSQAPERRIQGLEECLVEVASAVAVEHPDDPLGRFVHLAPLGVQDFLVVEEWGDPGEGKVAFEVLSGRAGAPVPRLTGSPAFAGPSVEIAALALVCHVAGRSGPGARLALALSIEGALAWFREADRLSPPAQAVTYALAHAAERLAQAGREAPPGLF